MSSTDSVSQQISRPHCWHDCNHTLRNGLPATDSGLNFIPEMHNGRLYSEIVYADDVPPENKPMVIPANHVYTNA
jgi:hypothetical protein